ncbi:adenosine receptor A2b-like [Montipora capricornis]|uniref:adenosine receptor A2b-like n=1 Tax=Montipora capricornis TaxID=246305 RepID=UPI0035F1FEBF
MNNTVGNSTCKPANISVHLTGIFLTLSVSGMLTSALGNSLIFLAVYKARSLRTPANYLLMSLSFASLLFIPVLASYAVSLTKTECDALIPYLCRWASLVDFALFCVVMAHLAVISLDRLLAIKMPMRYQALVTKNRTKALIIFLWIIGTLEAVFPNILQVLIDRRRGKILLQLLRGCIQINRIPGKRTLATVVPHFLFLMSLAVFVPSGIMLITHAWIFKISSEQNRRIRVVQDAMGLKRLSEIRAAKTVAIIVFSALACFTPLLVVDFITTFEPPAGKTLDPSQFNVKYILFPSLKILTLLAICVNPLIYALKSRPFKEVFKRIFETVGISLYFELKIRKPGDASTPN